MSEEWIEGLEGVEHADRRRGKLGPKSGEAQAPKVVPA
jgi:hypothetical protein